MNARRTRRSENNGDTDPRRRTPWGEFKAPKFVKFHPRDDGAGCDEIFWQGTTTPLLILISSISNTGAPNPLTFTPRRGRDFIDSWGIYPVIISLLRVWPLSLRIIQHDRQGIRDVDGMLVGHRTASRSVCCSLYFHNIDL